MTAIPSTAADLDSLLLVGVVYEFVLVDGIPTYVPVPQIIPVVSEWEIAKEGEEIE